MRFRSWLPQVVRVCTWPVCLNSWSGRRIVRLLGQTLLCVARCTSEWALLLQSAEELDKERLEAREKVDAQGKQQRQENARRNAEAVAQQKVSQAC